MLETCGKIQIKPCGSIELWAEQAKTQGLVIISLSVRDWLKLVRPKGLVKENWEPGLVYLNG